MSSPFLVSAAPRAECLAARPAMGYIMAVIRSCWPGGVEALWTFTQIGAFWVNVRSDGLAT